MEWLKDPKNQPKVAAGLSVMIVLALVLMYFLYFKPPSAPAPDTSAAPSPDASAPAGDLGAGPVSPGPVAPDQQQAAPAPQAQVAAMDPMEAWRSDPFLPVGYKPSKAPNKNIKPPIRDFPFARIPVKIQGPDTDTEQVETPQPVRRMAGILLNGRIYAIIETNGEAEIVQPGDTLKDRLASVERIERDKVVLKTKDKKPRYIVVKMAASPRQPTVGSDVSGGPTVREPMMPTGQPGRPVAPGRTREGDIDFD